MRIAEIARRGVVGVQVTETMAEAARVMVDEGVGSVVVFDDRRFVGILTEKDVVRAMAAPDDCASAQVRDFMAPEPIVATPSDESADVAARMIELGVRHLPIVEFGDPVGMVSARDLLQLEAWPRIPRPSD